MHPPPADDAGDEPEVLDPRVRARADEHAVDRDLGDRGARLERHVGQRPLGGCRGRPGRRAPPGPGRTPSTGATIAGVRPPGDLRRERAGVDLDLAVEDGVRVRRQRRQSSSACSHAAPPARRAYPRGRRRSCRRARSSRPARRPRSTCCRSSSGPSIDRPRTTGAGVLDHVPDAAGDADLADRAEDRVLRGHAERQLAVEARRASSSAAAAAASASRARARPPTCRSRTRARRTRRASRCGCRRRRSSSPAG